MAPVGVLVRFEAKPDMVAEVEALLTALAGQVQREESTIA
jgi:quinol monooxygenase YgiN